MVTFPSTPHSDRATRRAVLSIGNLATGGRGKTPTVACVARLLMAAGERPAILSRGYHRRQPEDGVVIVSDGRHLRADIDRSGDEPLMLARSLPGASVLVCDVRAIAAAVAEATLDVTVHLLDDGLQHRSLKRDIDLVLVTPADLADRRMPFGRLRSSVRTLRHVDAVIVDGADAGDVASQLDRLVDRASTPVFSLRRHLAPPRWIDGQDDSRPLPTPGDPVVAVAGIAGPARFQHALEAAGWKVSALLGFPDHHRYTSRDLARIAAAAGDRVVMTTDKDAVRLLLHRPLPTAVAVVPLIATVEPEPVFRTWLLDRLAGVRA